MGGTRNVRPPSVGLRRKHPHGARLPEQHAVRGRLGRRWGRDRAAVAAKHEVDAGGVQLVDRGRRSVRAGNVDRPDLDLTAVHAAVQVGQVGRQQDPSVLVDPAGTLRARERVDRPHLEGVGVARAARAGRSHHREREHRHRELPHRIITASRLAAACVAAGTVQVPEAHRCHDSSRPAPRSTGNAAGAVERHVDRGEQQGRADDGQPRRRSARAIRRPPGGRAPPPRRRRTGPGGAPSRRAGRRVGGRRSRRPGRRPRGRGPAPRAAGAGPDRARPAPATRPSGRRRRRSRGGGSSWRPGSSGSTHGAGALRWRRRPRARAGPLAAL